MEQRLTLLMQSKVISEHSYQATLKVLPVLVSRFGVNEENQQYQMLVTHLARAADRVLNNEQIEAGLDEETWLEIQQEEGFSELMVLNNELLALYGIEATNSAETSFLVSNLFSLQCATDSEATSC